MISDPISHFQKLSALLGSTKVTGLNGTLHSLQDGIKEAVELILRQDQMIMVIGNGGSAAIASHFHNDLCHAVGVRAMVFNDSSQLTALSNDHGYPSVFERPIKLWAGSGDLLVAISSSGKSENILRAVEAARTRGCGVITFSGFRSDNPLRKLGDLNFYVSSESYGEVEVSHMALTHFLTDSGMAARSQQSPKR